MAKAHGTFNPRFENVKKLFEDNIESGAELGASLYVDIAGERVLDLYGGYSDIARTKTWEEDTIGLVWSCTKVVVTLAALILASKHELDLDAKVSQYWPEFAANGKQDITVAQVLMHASGLSGWEPALVGDEIYDLKKATDTLAAQAPWWTPGSASGYHLTTYGHLVGGIIRKITGQSLKQFVAENLAGPCGADFQIGLDDNDLPRAAELVGPDNQADIAKFDKTGFLVRSAISSFIPVECTKIPAFRASEIGASGGFCNARGLAQIAKIASLGGEMNGRRYISSEILDRMFQENIKGLDLVMNIPLRWGLGVCLPDPSIFPYIPDTDLCFWFGWGGSCVIMDRKNKMTIAYTMNKMGGGLTGSERTAAYVGAIYSSVLGSQV